MVIDNLLFNPTLVEAEDFESPGPARHIRLTKAGQDAVDKTGYAQVFAHAQRLTGAADYKFFEYKAPPPERCEYCGRKVSVDRANCRGCGAPY